MTTGTDARFEILPLVRLHESPLNPRKHFDEKKLDELTASVKAKGVQTPLIVRPNANGFEIAAGHRRYRAAKAAKLAAVPVFIKPMTDEEFLELLNFENLLREDVHPLEEADGYRTLMEKSGYDVPAIAAKIGKSVAYVYARLKLADLVAPGRKAFLADEITAGHAILLARLQPKDQAAALKACIREAWVDGPDRANADRVRAAISVRELGAWIQANVHLDLSKAPFATDDAELVMDAGPCTTCPKRTGNSPELVPDVKKGDTCTDPACYQAKRSAELERHLAALPIKGKAVQVSDQWYAGGDGLGSSQWREAKPESCNSLWPAVHVDKARALIVCTNQKCREHFPPQRSEPSEYSRDAKRAYQRAAEETKIRKTVLRAILAKVDEDLPRPVRELVARGFFNDVWHEARKDLIQVLGWTEDKAKSRPDEIVAAKLPKISGAELSRVVVGLAVAKDLHAHGYGGQKPETLAAMAKAYKVDADKIRRDAAAAAKAKGSKKAAAKRKPVPAKAKKKAKRS
jgi:ParB family chromosome partitioning protein